MSHSARMGPRRFAKLLPGLVLAAAGAVAATPQSPSGAASGALIRQQIGPLFGYEAMPQAALTAFPQWVRVLERELSDARPDPACTPAKGAGCERREWLAFLDSVRRLPAREQLSRVNRYGNEHPYVLDQERYGREDYWAIPREFLPGGGDCEDFVITKFFSLKRLGYAGDDLRLVVVQDTNLRVPHAVLAVHRPDGTWVLDNQVDEVRQDRDILHYAPVYSVNERQWWLHVPR